MARLILLFASLLGPAAPLFAQADPASLLLQRVEQALNAGDREAAAALFASDMPSELVDRHLRDFLNTQAVRTGVFERDRAALEGVPEGEGYRLVVEFFIETAGRARVLTAGLDIQRPPEGDLASWRIVNVEGVASVEGLYRLRLHTAEPLAARGLEITSEDLVLRLDTGTVFLVQSDDGVTGMVLIGRGRMQFLPTPATERGQVRLFSGEESIDSSFEEAFVRISPSDYGQQVAGAVLTPTAADDRLVRRAREVFARESPRSYNVDVQDMSAVAWHLLPARGDFVAEVDTNRHGELTYARASVQAEDVSLFRRRDRKTIALYPSKAKLAARGRFYSDDALREYDVLDYAIDAAIDPERREVRGRARLSIRIRTTSLQTILVRLADPLTVTGVTSVEYGRLLHLRLRSQNLVLINPPRALSQDSDLTLVITYTGRLPSENLDLDTVQVVQEPPSFFSDLERSYLLSNQSLWYPQNPIPDYATATLRITVPNGYSVVASGEPVAPSGLVSLRDLVEATSGETFAFRASQPLRYLAVAISRFTRVGERAIEFSEETAGEGGDPIDLAVESNPRLQSRGRALLDISEQILNFYTELIGDAPYASATIAVVESELPGGHSPAYFVLINQPSQNSSIQWRGDPASFEGFPDFFIAHELAHQWWGQAIGWKNYHEQWLSEGFAQYFAALYARETRGERVFSDMLRQFRRWSLSESDQGPVYLGYRLGHIKGDLRVFRALVYNKGAAVLHMLRRLVGDDAFFAGLRQFYRDRRYQKAGTDDFERAMEIASGRELDRFFERWIYNAEMPRVVYTTAQEDDAVVVRFEQPESRVFDLPVTVTIEYADRTSEDIVISLTEARVEQRIPTTQRVRNIEINRDHAALAEFDRRR